MSRSARQQGAEGSRPTEVAGPIKIASLIHRQESKEVVSCAVSNTTSVVLPTTAVILKFYFEEAQGNRHYCAPDFLLADNNAARESQNHQIFILLCLAHSTAVIFTSLFQYDAHFLNLFVRLESLRSYHPARKNCARFHKIFL